VKEATLLLEATMGISWGQSGDNMEKYGGRKGIISELI